MKRVILVDDEPSLLEIGSILIEKYGDYEADTASSVDEALEKIKYVHYAAIISDYEMPRRNGIEFLRIVRAMEGNDNSNSAFILFTNRTDEDVIAEAVDSGADYFVAKGSLAPKEIFSDLVLKIDSAIGKRSADARLKGDYYALGALRELLAVEVTENVFSGIMMHAAPKIAEITKSSWAFIYASESKYCPECAVISGPAGTTPCTVIPESARNVYAKFEGAVKDKINDPFKSQFCNKTLLSDAEGKSGKGEELYAAVASLMNSCGIKKTETFSCIPVVEAGRLAMYVVLFDKNNDYDESDCLQAALISNGAWVTACRRVAELEAAGKESCGIVMHSTSSAVQKTEVHNPEANSDESVSAESYPFAITSAKIGMWERSIVYPEDVWMNDVCAEILGYDKSIGNIPVFQRDVLHPDDAEAVMHSINDCISGKTEVFSVAYRNRRSNGRYVWVASTGRVNKYSEDGKPLRIAGIIQDVTDNLNDRRALTLAQKKLEILFSITKHDIINQTAVISGSVEILKDALESDKTSARFINNIGTASDVIAGHIKSTSKYIRAGLEKYLWYKADELMNTIAGELPGNYEFGPGLKGLEIYSDQLFYSVIYNIIENSYRHSGEEGPGTIRVNFTRRSLDGILSISDEGQGVADDIKDKIFRRGFGTNTGTGLYVAHEILGINGMKITECGKVGVGARFEITIPLEYFAVNRV